MMSKPRYVLLAWGNPIGSETHRDLAGTVYEIAARPGFRSAVADARDLDEHAIAVPGGRTAVGHGVTINYHEIGRVRTIRASRRG